MRKQAIQDALEVLWKMENIAGGAELVENAIIFLQELGVGNDIIGIRIGTACMRTGLTIDDIREA